MERVPASDLHTLWEYSDPAKSETRFTEQIALADAAGASADALEYRTQVARTHSLRRQFAEAHALLDTIEPLLGDTPSVGSVRYHLERGRTLRSAGDNPAATPHFEKAFAHGEAIGAEFLTIDAAHMVAIVYDGEAGHTWNIRAIELARKATSKRAQGWEGSLLNNLGWDLHAEGRFTEALARFEQCQAFMEKRGYKRIARYSIARTLRSLERYDDALAILTPLHAEITEANAPDGYISEELGEVWLAKGDPTRAAPFFAAAHALLSKDAWLTKSEPERIERLRTHSQVAKK